MDNIARPFPLSAAASATPGSIRDSCSAISSHGRDALGSLLDRAIEQTARLEPDLQAEKTRLSSLRERLEQGRLNLAVLGQFKRGKSTLLNAFLGEPVLPTSVVPLTAVPTFIRPGTLLKARVLYEKDLAPEEYTAPCVSKLCEFLARFVTEAGNPKNRLGVSQVEVEHTASILQKGVVLIDTPGIGSTFRHNTEATLNFLPQCDAALFLVSADPPITEVEVEFLKQVRTKISRIFFILNKVDYLSAEEREAALAFFKRVLKEQAGVDGDAVVFCVSARRGLEARQRNNSDLWAESGLADVEKHLVDFLAHEKAAALNDALTRKAAAIVGEALMRLQLDMRSLQMPIEELRKRLEVFDQKLVEIEQEKVTASDLLLGDKKRLHQFLEDYSEQLRRKSRTYLEGIVKERLSKQDDKAVDEEAVQEALAEAIPGLFEHELGQATTLFEKKAAETLRPHQERADRLIEAVRKTAAQLFDVPYHAPESGEAFEMVRQPYWVTHKWSATLHPLTEGLVDRLLPAHVRLRRVLKRLQAQIADLVMQNVENLRWATYQSLDHTFLRFGSSLNERLAETIGATHGAIQAAMKKRNEQAASVAEEVQRLESVVVGLTEISAGLQRRVTEQGS